MFVMYCKISLDEPSIPFWKCSPNIFTESRQDSWDCVFGLGDSYDGGKYHSWDNPEIQGGEGNAVCFDVDECGWVRTRRTVFRSSKGNPDSPDEKALCDDDGQELCCPISG